MELNPLYLLGAYGFRTNVPYQSSTVTMKAVTTAIKDGISIDENGKLVVEGVEVGTVEAGSQISDVTLDGNDNLVITYVIEDGTTKTITTSLAKLVDVYKSGEGINVEDNTISINDDDVATQAELDAVQTQVTELQNTAITSVELSATDDYSYELLVNNESKGGFTLPDTENFATQEEITTLSAVVENNAGQIAALQAMVEALTAKVDALS
ncbi:MAG: hypothetical protein LUD72_05375 [Bacteroidales bacterium]|nr:hypothetical protein [Bacteroidales bacterium]